MNHEETLAHIERNRAERTRANLTGERRQLCIDMAVLKARLSAAGLFRTLHKMDLATKEVADLEMSGKR